MRGLRVWRGAAASREGAKGRGWRGVTITAVAARGTSPHARSRTCLTLAAIGYQNDPSCPNHSDHYAVNRPSATAEREYKLRSVLA